MAIPEYLLRKPEKKSVFGQAQQAQKLFQAPLQKLSTPIKQPVQQTPVVQPLKKIVPPANGPMTPKTPPSSMDFGSSTAKTSTTFSAIPQKIQGPLKPQIPMTPVKREPEPQSIFGKDASLEKFGKRVGTEVLYRGSQAWDFLTTYIAHNPEKLNPYGLISGNMESHIERLFPGKLQERRGLKDAWIKHVDSVLESGYFPSREAKKTTEALANSDFMKSDPEWQKASWQEKFTTRLPQTIYESGPALVGSFIPYLINPGVGFAVTAGSTAEDVKQDAMRYGVNEKDAENLGLGTGLAVGFLDKVVPDKILGGKKKEFIKGFLKRMTSRALETGKVGLQEGLTEMGQENIQILAESTFRDDLGYNEIEARNATAGLLGVLGGSGLKSLVDVSNYIAEKKPAAGLSMKDVSKKYENPEEARSALKDWKPVDGGYEIGEVEVKNTSFFPKETQLPKDYQDSPSYKYWVNRLKEGGEMTPVIVEPTTFSDGTKGYSVRDGIHRISAAEEVGMTKVPALIMEKGDEKLTRTFTKFTPEELSRLIPDNTVEKMADDTKPLFEEAKKYKSAEEFVNAQQTKSPNYAIGGGSGHTAPLRSSDDAPAFQLQDIYPEDIYSENAERLYSTGFKEADHEALKILKEIKGNPDAEVKIYRAVPKDLDVKDISAGDWVTLTKDYAVQHGESNLKGKYKILEKTVKADEIFTDANSIQEFGYDPRILSESQLTDIWDKVNNKTKTNKPVVAYSKTKGGEFDLTEKQARKILEKLFPNENPKDIQFVLDELLDVNEKAYGKYADQIITVFAKGGKIQSETLFHEALHRYIDLYIPTPEKRALFAEVAQRHAEDLGGEYGDSKLSPEEWLAHYIQEYISSGKTFTGRIKLFIQKIVAFARKWAGRENTILDFYNKFLKDQTKQRLEKPSFRTEPAYSKIEPSKMADLEYRRNQEIEQRQAQEVEKEQEILYAREGSLEFVDGEQERGYQNFKDIASKIKKVLEIEDYEQLRDFLVSSKSVVTQGYESGQDVDNGLFAGATDNISNDNLFTLFKNRLREEKILALVSKQKTPSEMAVLTKRAVEKIVKRSSVGKKQSVKKIIAPEKAPIIETREDKLLKEKLRAQSVGARAGARSGQQIEKARQDIYKKDALERQEKRLKFEALRASIIMRLKTFREGEMSGAKIESARIKEVQSEIVNFANENLPVTVRGKFLSMIKNARTGKDVINAFFRILEASENYQKRVLVQEIVKKGKRFKDTLSIAPEYRKQITDIVDNLKIKGKRDDTIKQIEESKKYFEAQLAQGKEVSIPRRLVRDFEYLQKQPLEELNVFHIEKIISDIEHLEQLGRTKAKARENIYEFEKERRMRNLLGSKGRPITYKDIKRRAIGGKLGVGEKFQNHIKTIYNKLKKVNVSLTPIDGLAKITGMTQMKDQLDLRYFDYLNHNNAVLEQREKLLKELKLDEGNFERIGVYAMAQQEGGLQKLNNLGITPEQVSEITLSPAENKYYTFVRETFDAEFPAIKKYMQEVYSEDVGQVENYVSFITDWDAMSELEIKDRFGDRADEVFLTKSVEKGFTEKRASPGKQKVQVDIDKIFLRHIDDTAYMLELGRDIKMFSEIMVEPAMVEKLGDVGNLAWREWLDLMARKGGVDGAKQIKLLDFLRKNVSASVLSFKLSSALVQVTAFADAAATIGPKWTLSGATNVVSSKKWREFIMQNFPEVRTAVGDDPVFMEMNDNVLTKFTNKGLMPLKFLDKMARVSTAIGAYQKVAQEMGVEVDLENPNKEVVQKAQKLVRKSQGSSLFKDQPLGITKGFLTGNRSLDKTLLTFQSFMLNRWDNIKDLVWREGFAKGNIRKGVAGMMWLFIVAGVLEEVMRGAGEKLYGLIFGNESEEKEPMWRRVAENSFSTIPFVGSLINSLAYDSNPIPMVSVAERTISGVGQAVKGKETPTKLKGGITAGLNTIGLLGGIPGMSELTSISKKAVDKFYDNERERVGSEKQKVADFYKKSIQSGNITKEEAVKLLSAELKKINSRVKNNLEKELPEMTKEQGAEEIKKLIKNNVIKPSEGISMLKKHIISLNNKKASETKADEATEKAKDRGVLLKSDEDSVLDMVARGVKAFGVDPVVAFKAMFTSEQINLVNDKRVGLVRMSEEASQAFKEKYGAKNKKYKLEHIEPIAIGGTNSKNNLRVVSTEKWNEYTKADNLVIDAVDKGAISPSKGRELLRKYKDGEISLEELKNSL